MGFEVRGKLFLALFVVALSLCFSSVVEAVENAPDPNDPWAYSVDDGKGTITVYSYPVNKWSGSAWVPIILNFEEGALTRQGKNYSYHINTTRFDVWFKGDFIEQETVLIEKDGFWITWQLDGVYYRDDNSNQWITGRQSSTPVISGESNRYGDAQQNIITYPNALGTGFHWSRVMEPHVLWKRFGGDNSSVLPSSEAYVLDNGEARLEFDEQIKARHSGLQVHVGGVEWTGTTTETNGSIELKDASGNLLWGMPQPFFQNSTDIIRNGVYYKLTKAGNKLLITTSVPYKYINQTTGWWRVDPTDTSSTISGDAYIETAAPDKNAGAFVYALTRTDGQKIYIVNFSTPSLSGIVAVDLVLSRYNEQPNSPTKFNASLMLETWCEGTGAYELTNDGATWYNRSGSLDSCGIGAVPWANEGAAPPTSSNSTNVDEEISIPLNITGERGYIGIMGANATNPMKIVGGKSYSFRIIATGSGQIIAFAQKEVTNASNRPYVTILYANPPSFSAYSRNPNPPDDTQNVDLNVTVSAGGGTLSLGRIQINNATNTINYTVLPLVGAGGVHNFTLKKGNYTGGTLVWYQWYFENQAGGNWSANQSFTVPLVSPGFYEENFTVPSGASMLLSTVTWTGIYSFSDVTMELISPDSTLFQEFGKWATTRKELKKTVMPLPALADYNVTKYDGVTSLGIASPMQGIWTLRVYDTNVTSFETDHVIS